MLQSYGGKLYIVGTTNTGTAANNELLLLHTWDDGFGGVTLDKSLGGTGNEFGTAMYISANGETTVAGRSNSFSTNPANVNDILVARYDVNGNLIFAKVLGTDSLDYATSVKKPMMVEFCWWEG